MQSIGKRNGKGGLTTAKEYTPKRGPWARQVFKSEYQYKKMRVQKEGFSSPKEKTRALKNPYYYGNLRKYKETQNVPEFNKFTKTYRQPQNLAQAEALSEFNRNFVKNQLHKRTAKERRDYLVSIGVWSPKVPDDYASPETTPKAA